MGSPAQAFRVESLVRLDFCHRKEGIRELPRSSHPTHDEDDGARVDSGDVQVTDWSPNQPIFTRGGDWSFHLHPLVHPDHPACHERTTDTR